MKRKIFISINVPGKIKKGLVRATEKWKDLPVKWVREANLHITLEFLGYVEEEMIPKICQRVREASEKEEIFDMNFEKIELFPSEKDPRLIALTGEANDSLKGLVNGIEEILEASVPPKRSFRPHITLGRIRKFKWEALPEKPEIEEKFPLTLTVETVDVMASDFGEGVQEYTILESCLLK